MQDLHHAVQRCVVCSFETFRMRNDPRFRARYGERNVLQLVVKNTETCSGLPNKETHCTLLCCDFRVGFFFDKFRFIDSEPRNRK